MPPNQEVRQPGQSTNQAQQQSESARQIQEQLVEEIRAIANNELERRRLAKSLSDAVKDDEVRAAEQRRSTQLQGQSASQTVSSAERQSQIKNIVRALKGVEQGIIEAPSESNKAVLLQLNQKVGTLMSEENAAFLQPLVSKLLESNQSVQDLQSQYDALKQGWGGFGPEMVNKVSEAIVAAAGDGKLSVNEEQAREMFSSSPTIIDPQTRSEAETPEQATFKEDWHYYYRHFFIDEDRPVIESLYSVDKLGKLVADIKKEIVDKPESSSLDTKTIDRMVSDELERKIVLTYSNMYSRIDKSRPDKTFEEIEQEGGIYDSIRAVESRFKSSLESMAKRIGNMDELPEQLRNIKFYGHYSIQSLREKTLPIGDLKSGEKKTQYQYKIIPVAGVQPVSLPDFLIGLSSEVVHENSIRRYLHNVQSLFLRPPGKDGFWSQVAGYSENLKSEDIDAMMVLPDNDKLISAYRLYVKHLEEEFAKVDWIHQPSMFDVDYFKNKSKIQQRVLEDLTKMYPELAGKKESWRLHRAMAMGVGLARGIYLSEAEIAASADPHIDVEKGAPKFTSYFTNDNAATETLNPLHFFLRWQAESVTMGPLIYMPVSGLDKTSKELRKWDHNKLWERMKQYRDSFVRGDVAFGGDPKDKTLHQLFVDILPNYAKGGSFITRGGWRMINATEGWLYDKNGIERSFIDKFKALEYIGYEAVKILDPFDKHRVLPEDKNTLFDYLARKYLANEIQGDLQSYISRLGGAGDKQEAKEKLFMNTVYSRMLQQRMPSKFVRLERDRLSKTGKSLWKMVKEDMGETDVYKFDDAMKDLSYVEVAVRNDISKEMRAHLLSQEEDSKDLSSFVPSKEFIVDEAAIRRHITDPEQQERVVKLYNSINRVISREKYLDVVAETLNSSKGYPFSVGAEELDTSFIAIRNAGSRVLSRALSDTAQIETKVTHNLKAFMAGLHHVSIDPRHDFSPLVKNIAEMKATLESIHGHAVAARVAQYMATMTVAYFKKDDVARNWRTKAFTIDRPNSLAAEFAGTHRGVWEWNVAEVSNFLTALERERIVAKNGSYDLSYQMGHGAPKHKKKSFLGVKWDDVEHDAEGFQTGKTLRDMLGANGGDITKEILTKYLPLAIAAMIYSIMMKALKEQTDKKH